MRSITDGKTGFPHVSKNSGGQLTDHTNLSFMRIVAFVHFRILLSLIEFFCRREFVWRF